MEMSHEMPPGAKTEWPELVGRDANEAEFIIVKENPFTLPYVSHPDLEFDMIGANPKFLVSLPVNNLEDYLIVKTPRCGH
uniref:Uncharacterized protein n=1 Tax=Cucumis sativus TaxID=3659 RepID=A0A0A0L652_CUCSA